MHGCDGEEPAVARRGERIPRVLREQERARQQQRLQLVPLVLGEVADRRDVLEAGVRDDGVERAVEALERRVDDRAVAFARREIAVREVDARAPPAVCLEPLRDRRADAARGARDERAPSPVVAEEHLGHADRLVAAFALDRRGHRAWSRQSASSTQSTRNVPRMREPDGTGAGKRTLFSAVVDGHRRRPAAARPRTTSRAAATASGSRAPIVVPNGPLRPRSGSTWIHWWSPVASANASIFSCGTSIQLDGPNSAPGFSSVVIAPPYDLAAHV